MDVKVSIVVPVYNRERQIVSCIESLLNQTLKEIEIIVINDGSTDNTAQAVLDIDDERIKLVNTENQGQGLARNIGIDMAVGEYIGFTDSDDTIMPEMFCSMYSKAVSVDADMVQCGINHIKGQNVFARPKIEDTFVEITSSCDYVRNYFHTAKHTNEVCNKIFKAEFLKENRLRFSDTRKIYSEDLKFNIDSLEKLRRVYFVKKTFYNYYMSESGHFMKAPKERLLKVCRLYEEAIDGISDELIKQAIKSTAVTQLFIYTTKVVDTKSADEILKSESIRNYLFSAMKYRKDFVFNLFVVGFMLSPLRLKKIILRKRYSKYL